MKKLFTYLMLWLTAVSADVTFTPAGDVPFTSTDNYYNGHNHEETNYQETYASYIDDASKSDSSCWTSIRYTEDDAVNVPTSTQGWKWMLYSSDSNQEFPELSTDAETTLLGATDGQIIIAPGTCTVITDAAESKYGTYMQVEVGDGAYTITFDNMERWFCCFGRNIDEKNDIGFTHSSNAKGVKLRQGNIIGAATPDTTVTIQKGTSASGRVISLKEFYTGSR